MVYVIWGTLSIIIASGIGMAGLPPKAVRINFMVWSR